MAVVYASNVCWIGSANISVHGPYGRSTRIGRVRRVMVTGEIQHALAISMVDVSSIKFIRVVPRLDYCDVNWQVGSATVSSYRLFFHTPTSTLLFWSVLSPQSHVQSVIIKKPLKNRNNARRVSSIPESLRVIRRDAQLLYTQGNRIIHQKLR